MFAKLRANSWLASEAVWVNCLYALSPFSIDGSNSGRPLVDAVAANSGNRKQVALLFGSAFNSGPSFFSNLGVKPTIGKNWLWSAWKFSSFRSHKGLANRPASNSVFVSAVRRHVNESSTWITATAFSCFHRRRRFEIEPLSHGRLRQSVTCKTN